MKTTDYVKCYVVASIAEPLAFHPCPLQESEAFEDKLVDSAFFSQIPFTFFASLTSNAPFASSDHNAEILRFLEGILYPKFYFGVEGRKIGDRAIKSEI